MYIKGREEYDEIIEITIHTIKERWQSTCFFVPYRNYIKTDDKPFSLRWNIFVLMNSLVTMDFKTLLDQQKFFLKGLNYILIAKC